MKHDAVGPECCCHPVVVKQGSRTLVYHKFEVTQEILEASRGREDGSDFVEISKEKP